MCRFYYYTTYLFDILSPFYLILASVDRVLVTSTNARTRQKSTPRLAYICIGCGTLLWMLFHCHALILTDIQEIAPGLFLCYPRAGPYVVFMGYYSMFVKAITVPLLMIIFGTWTANNIRKVRQRRIAPVIMNNGNTARNSEQPFHSKDRQFVLMVVVDICIYVVCNTMLYVVVIYYQIAQNTGLTPIGIFLSLVGSFLSDISYCIGCYAYLFISKTFRKEVKRLFFCQ
ncbi:unnamed protein product [Adineta steineri]|uniref:G-protein coupled receptors family 1 profile domain-containing protein n=1 Tax=Adineta steineri TaxID=433720 RepID=A0A819I444_9BILA|nr:unnamed protein product [Adineta steineri]